MNRMTLKKMTLRNFKGIREMEIDFQDGVTSILGRNGSGKTTLFDAFTWVLFGKDSRDRQQFQLMTLDSEGNEIPRLMHEVSLWLDVDGREVMLTRRKTEKWVKRRGSAVEEKTGTEEERLYNDIPCSVKEWDEKIQALCPYEVFKYITSPTYFAGQKAEVQRELLFRMAGGISDEEVADGNEGFKALLQELGGDKTMDEYKREISAKKKRIKSEAEAYPIRIQECNSMIDEYADVDFDAAEKRLEEKKQHLAGLNSKLESLKGMISDFTERNNEAMQQFNRAASERIKYESKLRAQMLHSYCDALESEKNLKIDIKQSQDKQQTIKGIIAGKKAKIKHMQGEREECLAERKAIKAQRLEFSADDFRCPTCGRTFEIEDIEAKKAEIGRRFNEGIARQLEANKERGMRNSQQLIAAEEAELARWQTDLEAEEARQVKLEVALAEIPMAVEPTDAEIRRRLEADEEYGRLVAAEQTCKEQLDKGGVSEERNAEAEITKTRDLLQLDIDDLNKVLGKKEIIETCRKQIKDYEKQMKAKAKELAKLEGMEFVIAEFARARVEAVESKINGLFKLVRFKMFDNQFNGGWKETCEATVGGVPYSALNNAMRINAGLDIINTICRHHGLQAPVFIDNAESVNELLPTDSQMVRLVVTEDARLTVAMPTETEKQYSLTL